MAPTPYQPKSRRPIAQALRNTAGGTVRLCVRTGIHPDAISWGSIVPSAIAALCFWKAGMHPWLVVPAVLLCYLRLWMNMLDGMVALAAGRASAHGEVVNELPDRFSDLLVFVGVAHGGLCHPLPGYWAAIAALLTAYVGTLGQAAGGRREFGGIMAKPWRIVVLHAGSWTAAGFALAGRTSTAIRLLDFTLLVILAGCIQTIAVRLARTFRALQEDR